MRPRVAKIILELVAVVAFAFVLNSCGSQPYCPTCGTTVNGAYGVLNVIPVPEHNPTGEPGGPFNSFDISWFDPNLQRVYTSDRIGLDIVVVDAKNNFAVNTIGGINAVANAGNNFSPCDPRIPSIVTGQGALRDPTATNVLTRFGCRNSGANIGPGVVFFDTFHNFFPGYGPNGSFGGFPGAVLRRTRERRQPPLRAGRKSGNSGRENAICGQRQCFAGGIRFDHHSTYSDCRPSDGLFA